MSALTPGSDEWARLVTASKVAAILGVSPWESPYSCWQRMKGNLPADDGNEYTRRGTYLEPAILAWWRDQHAIPGDGDPPAEYRVGPTYTLGDWAAATPDMVACHPEDDTVLVEAKSAARDDDWGTPGTDEIPTYYLVQVVWQMHASGIHRCYVPVLTSRLRFVEYVVDYEPEWGEQLEARMRAFYDTLAADEPPPLDASVATYEAVRALHPDIDRGEEVELTHTEAWNLARYNDAFKTLEADLRGAKTAVLDRMGRAQYATHNGVRIARRQPRGDAVSFVTVANPADIPRPEGETAA